MYTIIGGDGKEYGPVTVDQVRAWIAGGRANLSTKVRAVGTDAWRTIAECPEITGSASSAAAGQISAALVSDRAVTLDFMGCYERSWTLLKSDFWTLVGVSFVVCMVRGALLLVEDKGLYFLGLLFNAVIGAGLFYYFLLRVRGQPATVGDAFAGFTKAFFKLVVIGLIKSVFVTVGLFCLILPGIYLLVAYVFAPVIAVDKGLEFWDSLELSRRVVTRNWWRVFALGLLFIPLFLVGALALGVGIFVAVPIAMGALAYAYEDLFNPAR